MKRQWIIAGKPRGLNGSWLSSHLSEVFGVEDLTITLTRGSDSSSTSFVRIIFDRDLSRCWPGFPGYPTVELIDSLVLLRILIDWTSCSALDALASSRSVPRLSVSLYLLPLVRRGGPENGAWLLWFSLPKLLLLSSNQVVNVVASHSTGDRLELEMKIGCWILL